MKLTVCIGSSCHIKGSRQVVEQLQNLIAEHDLKDKVELGGTFCMGKCQQGVCTMSSSPSRPRAPRNSSRKTSSRSCKPPMPYSLPLVVTGGVFLPKIPKRGSGALCQIA